MKDKTVERRNLLGGGFGSLLNFSLAAKKIKRAFTVAEVLVTLAVIGVIASLVVSRIKLKMYEITTVAKVRNVYSLISASFDASVKKYGTPDKWELVGTLKDDEGVAILDENTVRFYSILLEGAKAENIAHLNKQTVVTDLNNKNGPRISLPTYFVLPGGVTFSGGWVSNIDCKTVINPNNIYLKNSCGDIRIDINGFDKPNIQGIDQFQFWVTKRGMIPMGLKDDLRRPVETHCDPNTDTPPVYNGYGCSAWIIEKGTMPWLYSKQVKWD